MNQSKRCSTPLEAKLRREEGSLLANPQPYRALVGSLLYLTITRPNISFSVGLVSRFMQSPRKPHLEAAKKILKYVNSTLDIGLFFEKKVTSSLVGFTDADFGGDLDPLQDMYFLVAVQRQSTKLLLLLLKNAFGFKDLRTIYIFL